LVQNMLGLVT